MDLVARLLTEWNQSDDSASPRRCSEHISRFLSALALAGSIRAQQVLSKFILDSGVFEAPSCANDAIEVTHRVVNPNESLFDTIYSLASKLGDPVQQTNMSADAMLALGTLGRAHRKFAGKGKMSFLSDRASNLLKEKFGDTIRADADIEGRHSRLKIQMGEAFRGASLGMRDHLMASIRSLTRL